MHALDAHDVAGEVPDVHIALPKSRMIQETLREMENVAVFVFLFPVPVFSS